MRIIKFCLIVSFLSSCSIDQIDKMIPAKITFADPSPIMDYPKIKLRSVKGTRTEIFKSKIAIDSVNEVLKSPCFQIEVFTRKFTEVGDLNNQEIYNIYRTAPIIFDLNFYTGSWSENHIFKIIGFVRDDIPNTVFQNRYFVQTEYDIGRNLMHEISHLLGFRHIYSGESSVPYQMNEIWDKCFID